MQILEIKSMDFTAKDLSNSYKIAAKKFHPDINQDVQTDRMYIVNEAHTILKEYLKTRRDKSETINKNKKAEKKQEEPNRETVVKYAKKFDISYSEAKYRYDTFKTRTNYKGSIIDYYENLMTKYYEHKDLIFELYNELKAFNGSLTYIIDEYEDSQKDRNISIIEWLQNRVTEKKVAQILNINIREIACAYQNDQTYGYDSTYTDYVKKIYSFITELNLEKNNYNYLKEKYKRKLANSKSKTFIDYLEIKLKIELLKKQINSDSDDLLYEVFEILEDNNNLTKTVEGIKEKVFKKTKF